MNTLITQYYKPDTKNKEASTTFYTDDDGNHLCKCSCGRIWDGCAQCPCIIDDC